VEKWKGISVIKKAPKSRTAGEKAQQQKKKKKMKNEATQVRRGDRNYGSSAHTSNRRRKGRKKRPEKKARLSFSKNSSQGRGKNGAIGGYRWGGNRHW